MSEEEAKDYFEGKALEVRMLKNYVDYENIDRPIQTIDDYSEKYPINIGEEGTHEVHL